MGSHFPDRHIKTSLPRRSVVRGPCLNMCLNLSVRLLVNIRMKLRANALMKVLVRVLNRWQLHNAGDHQWLPVPAPDGTTHVAIHLPDELQRYLFGTYCFTLPMIGAAAE